jgi:ATP-dependent RNA helicase SUPV3L1/SUV3
MSLSFSAPSHQNGRNAGAGVTAVLGPTNTGKTHLAIERMIAHSSGIIGLPLRLLAREVYNKIVQRIGPDAVALVTGEEKIKPANPRFWVSTVEAMPRDLDVAFVAVDEIQLGADLERGHVFTDRILNRRGREETLILGAQTVRPMVEQLLPGAHILSRPRMSQLTHAGDRKITRLPRRSAIVAFSADEVYAIAELIRRQRGGTAVVLGALSPRTRNAQVELYQSGDVDYLIATDAIGMGLNLDVDHVAFASDRKFDGYQFRRLNPAEMAQIAGRAGRAMRDGTFGTTGRCEPFEPELAQALESHSFEPIKVLQWRNTKLDFSSFGALQTSLAVTPSAPGLTRAPVAEDILVLEHTLRDEDVRSLATSPAAIERLWEVCQVPDYRKISPSAHAELVITLYGFLRRQGRLPEDWFARQIAFSERTDGDIDTLSARIAHIRTWTFAANRADWLADPEHWQGITRGVEDKLSDALHERLLHRFVDRRTSVLMRRLRENTMLETEISKTGEVLVEGHPLGRLAGFRFVAETSAAGSEAKALQAAAQKALAGEINARSTRLSQAPDEQFVLTSEGTVRWLGDVVAKMSAGDHALRPQLRLIADEQLTGAPRDAVQVRLDLWLKARIEKLLGPLVALEKAEDVTGLARGIAFQLVEALGILERQKVADQLKGLDQAGRAALRQYGVRFGAYHIYVPALLKPAPRILALQLWALKQDEAQLKGLDDLPQLTAGGRTSLKADKDVSKDLYRTVGYRVCGERAVRVDILERLADLIRPALAWRPGSPAAKPSGAFDGSGFTTTGAMTSLVGSSGEDFASILRSLGYRAERRPKPAESAPANAETQVDAGAATVVAAGVAPVAPDEAADAEAGARSGAESPAPDAAGPVGAAPGFDAGEQPQPQADETDALALGDAPVAPEAPASSGPQQTANLPEAATASESSEAAHPHTPDAPASVDQTEPELAATEPRAATAAEPASGDVSAEPEMVEVWRPGRVERRRPDDQRQQRAARRERYRPAPQAASAEPQGAAAPAPQAAEPAPGARPQHRRGRKPEGEGQKKFAGSRERPAREDRGREGRPQRSRNADWKAHVPGPERRDKAPDPNSPFAKLLALKEQLEANPKDRG